MIERHPWLVAVITFAILFPIGVAMLLIPMVCK
jgi:hypothetical protein